ncbi:MAG: helix-turn-helix domain-containing protein [Methylovulum sp.]|nr:helix-turn-helix domain-containing protein [Methylovulum sp.]
MIQVTAEKIFAELQMIPLQEQEKFFALVARKAFSDDENLSHDDLFGDLKNAEFTAKEAMSYLEVSSATFRRYVRDGKITPSTEIGTSHLFRLTDLRKLKAAIRVMRG